jgi:hypothetical protein
VLIGIEIGVQEGNDLVLLLRCAVDADDSVLLTVLMFTCLSEMTVVVAFALLPVPQQAALCRFAAYFVLYVSDWQPCVGG